MKDALADALRSGDFKHLNDLVSQTVINTVNEVKRQVASKTEAGHPPAPESSPFWFGA